MSLIKRDKKISQKGLIIRDGSSINYQQLTLFPILSRVRHEEDVQCD